MNAAKVSALPKRSLHSAAGMPSKSVPAPSDGRYERISMTAYYLAERRGFAAGGEVDDWLRAETMVANDDLT